MPRRKRQPNRTDACLKDHRRVASFTMDPRRDIGQGEIVVALPNP